MEEREINMIENSKGYEKSSYSLEDLEEILNYIKYYNIDLDEMER